MAGNIGVKLTLAIDNINHASPNFNTSIKSSKCLHLNTEAQFSIIRFRDETLLQYIDILQCFTQ